MNSWSGRTVLVTGAGGFIGSHLAERLVEAGATTRALVRYTSTGTLGWLERSPVRDSIEVFAGDICDAAVVERAVRDADVIFHLAALIGIPYSYHAPASYVRTNIEGTLTVLEAVRRAGVSRLVHTSTSEVYGTAVTVPMPESHPLQAQSPYAASKTSADVLAMSYYRSFGLDVRIIRPFNTYGPRQSSRAVIPTIITQALAAPSIKLGHLSPTRDYTFVADTVDAFLRVGEAAGIGGETFNIGSGQEVTVRDLAARVQMLTGTNVPVVTDSARERPDASEVERLCADVRHARTRLGWAPRVTLDEGLRRTIDWISAHLDLYRPEVYGI
jgi:dTDP-glucose 4,6-dehydratase